MSHYFLITASHVKADQEDHLSGLFFANGAEGISEDLKFSQFDDQYNVQTEKSESKKLNIYFTNKPKENLLLKASGLFPNVLFKVEEQPAVDWMSEWKKGFHAFELTSGVKVIPSWEKAPDNNDLKIFIDPGMAFGTGTHATTQIAATLIQSLSLTEMKMLDVGTGTGILAILANQKGASQVYATETDEVARQVAKENIVRNRCKNTLVLDEQVESIKETFDVVVANIIDGVLIRIQNDLIRKVRPEGSLILTGILAEREPSFLRDFDLSQFSMQARLQKEEWVGFQFQKVKL